MNDKRSQEFDYEDESEDEEDLREWLCGYIKRGVTNVTMLIIRHLRRNTSRYIGDGTRYSVDYQRFKA